MDDILARLSDISADPYSSVAKTRERTGKKAIAVFPMHIPEEVVHAAGMLPVVLWRGNEPVTLGHSHVATFNCGLVRSFVDDAVRGKLAFLDGVVLWRQCLQAQGLRYIIERSARPPFGYLEYLYLPALFPNMESFPGAAVKDFLLEEFGRLKTGMEKLAGCKVTTESLRHSIAIYNRDRDLIRQAYELRRQRPGMLSAREAMAIVQSSMLMPKEEHAELLEKLLPELKRRKAAANGKVRV
ncbi:MAG: 2-hydroxyacyl-CoA dehydratase family protein, partial [Chloroflexota bacterium]